MRPLLVLAAFVLCVAPLGAQGDPTKPAASSSPATANNDSSSTPSVTWGAGVGAGLLRFPGNAQERAVSAGVSAHLWGWIDVSVNPTYASATAADTVISGRTIKGRTANGLTALPVSIGVSHNIAGPWSPSVSAGVGFALPMGDSTGVGSSSAGYGLNLDVSVSPSDQVSLSFDASHALNNSFATGLGFSSPTSIGLGGTVNLGKVSASTTWSGDVGSVPDGYESAQSLGLGLSIPLRGDMSLSLNGSSGLTNGAPSWAFSAGIGTTPAGVASVLLSPLRTAGKAFGAGRTFHKSKPATKPRTHGKNG
ncbi:MAG: hypothetical protein HY084_06300 [Gemmatimonadetes bacterium]|nr:hypothetical protein [Gemmatimonadota bacterium]